MKLLEQEPFIKIFFDEEEFEEKKRTAEIYRNIPEYLNPEYLTEEDYREIAEGIMALEEERQEEMMSMVMGISGGGLNNVTGKAAKAGRVAKFFEKFRAKLGIKPKVTSLQKVEKVIEKQFDKRGFTQGQVQQFQKQLEEHGIQSRVTSAVIFT